MANAELERRVNTLEVALIGQQRIIGLLEMDNIKLKDSLKSIQFLLKSFFIPSCNEKSDDIFLPSQLPSTLPDILHALSKLYQGIKVDEQDSITFSSKSELNLNDNSTQIQSSNNQNNNNSIKPSFSHQNEPQISDISLSHTQPELSKQNKSPIFRPQNTDQSLVQESFSSDNHQSLIQALQSGAPSVMEPPTTRSAQLSSSLQSNSDRTNNLSLSKDSQSINLSVNSKSDENEKQSPFQTIQQQNINSKPHFAGLKEQIPDKKDNIQQLTKLYGELYKIDENYADKNTSKQENFNSKKEIYLNKDNEKLQQYKQESEANNLQFNIINNEEERIDMEASIFFASQNKDGKNISYVLGNKEGKSMKEQEQAKLETNKYLMNKDNRMNNINRMNSSQQAQQALPQIQDGIVQHIISSTSSTSSSATPAHNQSDTRTQIPSLALPQLNKQSQLTQRSQSEAPSQQYSQQQTRYQSPQSQSQQNLMKTYDTVTQRTYLSKDSTWSQINQSKFNYNTNTEFEPNSKSSQNFNTISKTSSSKSNITSKSQDCGEELQTLSTGIIISNQSNDPQNKPSSLPKDIYPTKLHNSQSSSLSQQANLTLSAISSPPMHILPSSSLNTYTINQSQYGRKQNQTTSSLSSQQSYRSHSSNSLHQAISTPPTPHSNNSNINNNSSMPMNSKQDNQSHLYNTIEQNQLRGCRFDCGVTIPLLPEYKNDSENQYNSNQVKSSRIDKQLQVDMRKENKQIKAYERENISTNRALEREKVNAELTSAQHKVNECLRVCDTLSTRISSLGATLETQPSSK